MRKLSCVINNYQEPVFTKISPLDYEIKNIIIVNIKKVKNLYFVKQTLFECSTSKFKIDTVLNQSV